MYKEWNNTNYIDILKGIGILSIIIGHSWYFASKYVYSYHLALFFFVSGFLYNEERYGQNPFLNLASRIKSNYPKYLFYSALIGAFHNFFIDVHIYNASQVYWTFYNFRNYILNSAALTNSELLYGATWFVLPLVFSSSIFGGIIYFGNVIKNRTQSHLAKNLVIIILGLVCCALGYERMVIKFILPMRLDVALFVIPLFIMAYFVKLYVDNYYKYLKWYIAALLFPLTIFLTYKMGWFVSLGSQDVIFYSFYVLSVIGIYQCMYLAKLIKEKLGVIANIFSMMGKYSFEIMAFHFLCFKIFDVLYSKAIGVEEPSVIETLPLSYEYLWPIYILIGCFVPTVCAAFIKNSLNILLKVSSNTEFKKNIQS
ncbi:MULTISPECIES: acyltransferase family protein [Dickeya]|uniref:O-actetyl transferase related protein n=1 Tax=Dickeya aquatica TaxID=1401087 RepID=A0A375ABA7_9GAMM|nr:MULTISPECIES: acyltransferase family protein [Dickeya]SLM62869.1 O-actetyl transferase related protein [Dickeya aquatica]